MNQLLQFHSHQHNILSFVEFLNHKLCYMNQLTNKFDGMLEDFYYCLHIYYCYRLVYLDPYIEDNCYIQHIDLNLVEMKNTYEFHRYRVIG
jgi:hypothetical protein